jgi:hypothetical protein
MARCEWKEGPNWQLIRRERLHNVRFTRVSTQVLVVLDNVLILHEYFAFYFNSGGLVAGPVP